MTARLLLGWTGALLLVIAVACALAANMSGVADYLTTYPLDRLSQALSGVAFTEPLTAGFCALNAARLRDVMSRPHHRNPLSALVLVLLPGVLGVVFVTILCALAVAGVPRSGSALAVVGLVVLALCASGIFGAAVGLVTHPAAGTPLSVLAAFAWFAMPVSTGINWLRTSNTTAPLASCCTPEQQYELSTLVTSASVSAVMIAGFAVAVATPTRRTGITLISATVAMALGMAVGLGRTNSFDGLAPRTDRPICSTADRFEVYVCRRTRTWPKPTLPVSRQWRAVSMTSTDGYRRRGASRLSSRRARRRQQRAPTSTNERRNCQSSVLWFSTGTVTTGVPTYCMPEVPLCWASTRPACQARRSWIGSWSVSEIPLGTLSPLIISTALSYGLSSRESPAEDAAVRARGAYELLIVFAVVVLSATPLGVR